MLENAIACGLGQCGDILFSYIRMEAQNTLSSTKLQIETSLFTFRAHPKHKRLVHHATPLVSCWLNTHHGWAELKIMQSRGEH